MARERAEVSHFLQLPLKAKVVRRCSMGARAVRKLTGKHYWQYRGVPILREPSDDQSFAAHFLKAPDECMLFGYFQSPIYFDAITDSLRAELNALLANAMPPLEQIHRKLADPQSVAVHVRRKDYLNLPIFQVCDNAYYQKSMNQLRAHLPYAHFFIFSDDPEWCRAKFCDSDHEVIDSGKAANNPLHDLRLMSLASHHIIANSSYSWWAAWLGNKPEQQVIMPDRWYTHGIKAPISEKKIASWRIV